MDIEYVRQVMKEKKITQIRLSELSGIPIQTLRKIFAGYTPNPRIDTVDAIEKALGITNEPTINLSNKEKEIVELLMQLDESQLNDALSVIKIIAKK